MIARKFRRCWMLVRAVALLLALSSATRSMALDAAQMQAMILAEGDEGKGSAFLVKMGGRTYLVTNSHVVRGNRNMTYKDLRNMTVTTGPLEIADRVDAVRAEVAGASNVLALESHVDQVKIGDEVVVAGNSEGEGVVREIPGKIVGIGPDRIEVDAQFVPGNSGSPILLKSTGKVIGVATYMKIPRGGGAGARSPMSLNEVRRFGYRIDTVASWVRPQTKDRLQLEGLKLNELESLMSTIDAVFGANAAFVAKWGRNGFVRKERAQQYPAFAAMGAAIDDFAKDFTSATKDDEKLKTATALFQRLRELVADDVRGLNESQFSGFYGIQLKESLKRTHDFDEWFEGTTMPVYRESWLASKANPMTAGTKPSIDPTKIHLILTDRIVASEPADYCHHVTYPAEQEPANLDSFFWVIENPKNEKNAFPMHKSGLRVHTTVSGIYRVSVEYRGGEKPVVVSNVEEVRYTDVAAGRSAPAPASEPPAGKVPPYVNTLGMQFLPVTIVGGTGEGSTAPAKRLLFSVWDTRVQDYEAFVKEKKASWRKPDFEQGPTHPAVFVSWNDAHSFCAWLTARERKAGKLGPNDLYRVPTDHEWSCAVGIGAQEDATMMPADKDNKIKDVFPWGAQWPPPAGAGNFAGKELQALIAAGTYKPLRGQEIDYQDDFPYTSPVGSFAANRYGLYDMAGNVWQWCEEWLNGDQNARVLRGSSWKYGVRNALLSAHRFQGSPTVRFEDFGFRCVLETASKDGVPGGAAGNRTK